MTISETVLILAGGTAALAILFGIRLAMRAVAGSGAAAPRPGGLAPGPTARSGALDVAGVIALPPLIFLGFLAAAAVLEAVVPLPLLAAHAIPRYLAGAALAAGGFVMIAMGARRFLAAGTNIRPTLPTASRHAVGSDASNSPTPSGSARPPEYPVCYAHRQAPSQIAGVVRPIAALSWANRRASRPQKDHA